SSRQASPARTEGALLAQSPRERPVSLATSGRSLTRRTPRPPVRVALPAMVPTGCAGVLAIWQVGDGHVQKREWQGTEKTKRALSGFGMMRPPSSERRLRLDRHSEPRLAGILAPHLGPKQLAYSTASQPNP